MNADYWQRCAEKQLQSASIRTEWDFGPVIELSLPPGVTSTACEVLLMPIVGPDYGACTVWLEFM